MKISSVSNNQPVFRAKLPKSEMNTLISSALSHDKEAGIPKLYTLLENLDKMPGERAEFKGWKSSRGSYIIGYGSDIFSKNLQLRVDGHLIEEGNDNFDVLYNAVTSAKTKDGKKIHMPKTVFDLMWWVNRDKSAEDVEALLRN